MRPLFIEEMTKAITGGAERDVEAYVAEPTARVRSVTVWNCIYKLRMAARVLDPKVDFAWLAEIEKDLALVMVPRSKFDRLVLSDRLVEAGLTLFAQAERYAKSDFERAKGIRNGLMIELLAVCPIRIKNIASLEIGNTFKEVHGSWWITLPYKSTKTKGQEQRPVPEFLNHAINLYLTQARPVAAVRHDFHRVSGEIAMADVDNLQAFSAPGADGTDPVGDAPENDGGERDDDELVRNANNKIPKWQATSGTPSLTQVQELFHESICAGASPMARDKIVAAVIAAFGAQLGGKRALGTTWNQIAK